jgi:hypothetical protein
MPIGKFSQELQDAVNILIECARECRHCAQACQDEDDAASLDACIRLNQDCADICALGADLLRRHSVFRPRLGELCSDAAEACAEECARHRELEQCRECEEVCRRCAEICRGAAVALA